LKISILKSFFLVLLVSAFFVSTASSEQFNSPAPPDTSGDSEVELDGGLITPIDTLRRFIDYFEQVRYCLQNCNNCLDSICDTICYDICDTLTNTDLDTLIDSGILTPTDTSNRLFNGFTTILQDLYLIEKTALLKLLYNPLSKKTLVTRKKYRSLLIRSRYLIRNFELMHNSVAFKKINSWK